MAMLERDGQSILISPGSTRHPTLLSGVERGMIPPRSGLMRLVAAAYARFGERLLLVPVHLAGIGSIMSNDYGRTARYGVGINRPIVMGIGEPFSARELDAEIRADHKTSEILAATLYARSAPELFAMQRCFSDWPE